MVGIILDKIEENNGTCFLSKITLHDYVTSLTENYQDYEVQREIVANTYLDNLIDTVLNKKHIPPIVLVVNQFTVDKQSIEIKEFKILDGLQRTYRLKLIWETINFFKNELVKSNDFLTLGRLQLSRKFSKELRELNSNSKILASIIKFYNSLEDKNALDQCYDKYQWFEIWSNLSPQEEVNKMLVLNAGHKPVKTQHQLEILFLNLIPILQKAGLEKFQLVREKEANSTVFSKNREKGQFHFSHLITAILSLNEGKPITANVNLVHKAQSSDFEIDQYEKYFNYDFLHKLIFELLTFDDILADKYDAIGTRWLGREVSIIGIFAALGKFAHLNSTTPMDILEVFQNRVVQKVEHLNLIEFEQARNGLDLSKINIGTVNKNAVYHGIYDLLINDSLNIDWSIYFKTEVL